jgi:hypothetical protein
MDDQRFYESNDALIKELGIGALLRSISSYQYNQVLVAGGHKQFSEFDATYLCKQLTGIIPDRRPKDQGGV